MDVAEFDRYADEYEKQLRDNIAVTGEGPEYFAEYKIADTARICEEQGLAPEKILDFGAGIGNSTPYIHRYFPQAEQISADVSSRSLDILAKRYPSQSTLTLIDNGRLPLDDDSIDLAFTACVFHHIEGAEHDHWLKELKRVVRPGGLFVLFEHNPYNPLTQRAVNTCPFDENAVLINAPEMTARLKSAGWQTVTTHYRIFFPHLLASLRPLEKAMTWLPLGGQYSLTARH